MHILRLLPRFQKAYRAVRQLAQREDWSRTEIETYQLDALNRLWRHAASRVPYYQNLHSQHRLPDRFSSLDEFRSTVPLLPKSTVRQDPQSFLSHAAKPGCWERTSGSTGMPMSLYHDHAGHRTMQHAKYRLYDAWGIDIHDRVAYLWSRADLVTPGLRGFWNKCQLAVTDTLRGRKRFSAFDLGKPALRDCLRQIERFQPRALYGFSNAVFLLAQEAAELRISSDWLKAVIMTSELATPRMRAATEKAFGAPVVIEYGATECELIAGLYPDGTMRVREDLVLVEALPQPGRGHDLVITVLTNDSFPLIRYQIGDVTEAPIEFPQKGFAILAGGIAGRRDDLLRTQDGGYLHATSIDAIFENVLSSSAIRRYRAHQAVSGALHIQIEVDPQRSHELRTEQLESTISKLLGGYAVRAETTAESQMSSASKHRAVTSDLTAGL